MEATQAVLDALATMVNAAEAAPGVEGELASEAPVEGDAPVGGVPGSGEPAAGGSAEAAPGVEGELASEAPVQEARPVTDVPAGAETISDSEQTEPPTGPDEPAQSPVT